MCLHDGRILRKYWNERRRSIGAVIVTIYIGVHNNQSSLLKIFSSLSISGTNLLRASARAVAVNLLIASMA